MKIWTIAWKDTLIRFRDRNALILMIAAPLVLSAIIGSAFGSFIQGSDPQPFDSIPVILVNADQGEFGQQFVDIFDDDSLAELIAVTEMDDLEAAREIVQLGDARAAVYIPDNFTDMIQGEGADDPDTDPATVQFYPDPSATLTPNIVRGIVTQIVNEFNKGGISGEVTVGQLMENTAVLGPAMAGLGDAISDELQATANVNNVTTINLNTISVGAEDDTPDVSAFAFFAPSMGILFLMFSMVDGTRSILDEEREGTLNRLISTPTSNMEILIGKIGGVFLTGLLQFVVFVITSSLIFGLNWGSSIPGLILMMLAVVLAFTSLGALIAAFARDENQANIIGSVVTLVFAALGGNFLPAQNFPDWLQTLSKLTITRWGLDGFTDLTIYDLGLSAIVPELSVLLVITAVLIILALWQFQRRIAR
ncbi:MAG: ABC transporter permease [Chloroflexi bacterium]|nr:ABC transporter permease [Chloroflexota bacterium]